MLETESTDARFQGLLDAAPDAIVGVDRTGRIMLVNGQAERLFGYARAELIGQLVETLVPDSVRAIHPSRRGGYVSDPKPRPMGAGMELAGRRKDGTEFPAEISLNAVETSDGLMVAAAVRDVTDRKRADAKFRGLLEAAPDAIVGVGRDGEIALVNAQTERLFGYTRAELIGLPVEILVPEAARAVHPSRRATYFAAPVPRPMGAEMQLAGRRKDGTEFPAEISLSAIETEDGLLVSAAIRDVTERMEVQAERERLKAQAERERMERQLHQSQRLESLGQLAGGVAHDFNNLLAVIANYASFVGEEIRAQAEGDPEHWEPVLNDVTEIERAAERATRLTHQLLAFGRREVVQPVVLNLDDVVRDVDRLLQRTLGEHIELVTELAEGLWTVLVDPGQLEQVLVNLAVNARDAMRAGGSLLLQTSNVIVDEEYVARRPDLTPGRHVRLRVSDTGSGMEPEVIERAFEPFFTTKPKGEGSGLGLATVYGIVTQAGGDTSIYSEIGVGTTISVMFPASADAPAAAVGEVKAMEKPGGATVLVVEDEDAMREVTRRILARNGYEVIVAAGGREAIAAANAHEANIDLLITDVIMPHMLGKEVAENITVLRPRARVLYMSGYAQPILASQGTLDPGVTLIEKPFSEQLLLAKVREVLDQPARSGPDLT
jgi:PAS domain S-box-containing protein